MEGYQPLAGGRSSLPTGTRGLGETWMRKGEGVSRQEWHLQTRDVRAPPSTCGPSCEDRTEHVQEHFLPQQKKLSSYPCRSSQGAWVQ